MKNIVCHGSCATWTRRMVCHQHELEKKAWQWAHCVESSHYFHYGIGKHKEADEAILQNRVEQS